MSLVDIEIHEGSTDARLIWLANQRSSCLLLQGVRVRAKRERALHVA